MPGFIGWKILKRGFRCVFKNAHDLFRAGIDGVRGRLNSLRATNGVGCSVTVGFHGLHTVDDQIPHCSGKSGLTEKHIFIEIGSQAEGGIFKKSDMSNTDRRMGVEAPVLLGFGYYKGR